MSGPSVTIEMNAKDLKVLQALQRLIDKNRDLENSLDGAGKKGKKAGDDVTKAIGDSSKVIEDAKKTVVGWAASFATVSGSIELVSRVIGKMNENLEKAKQLTESMKNERANLASVANSVEDYRSLESRANAAAIQYGIDPNLASRMMFSARSSGYEGSFETAARFGSFFDPNAVSTVADKIPQIFRGQVNADQSLNAVYAAAKFSNLDFAQIAEAAPSAAEGGSMLGSSPAETLGVLSVLASQFGRGSTAADRMKAFGVQMSLQPGFEGLGYVGSVRRLQGMSEEERRGILGSGQELNVAYQKLTENLDQIVGRVADVDRSIAQTGTAGDMISQYESVYLSSPLNRSLLAREQERIRGELLGEGANSEVALRSEAEQLMIRNQHLLSGRGNYEISSGDLAASLGRQISPRYGAQIGQAIGTELPGIAVNSSTAPGRFGTGTLLRAGMIAGSAAGSDDPRVRQGFADAASYIPDAFTTDAIGQKIAEKVVNRLLQNVMSPRTLSEPDADR